MKPKRRWRLERFFQLMPAGRNSIDGISRSSGLLAGASWFDNLAGQRVEWTRVRGVTTIVAVVAVLAGNWAPALHTPAAHRQAAGLRFARRRPPEIHNTAQVGHSFNGTARPQAIPREDRCSARAQSHGCDYPSWARCSLMGRRRVRVPLLCRFLTHSRRRPVVATMHQLWPLATSDAFIPPHIAWLRPSCPPYGPPSTC